MTIYATVRVAMPTRPATMHSARTGTAQHVVVSANPRNRLDSVDSERLERAGPFQWRQVLGNVRANKHNDATHRRRTLMRALERRQDEHHAPDARAASRIGVRFRSAVTRTFDRRAASCASVCRGG